MTKRSLKASVEGLEKLNQALVRNGQSKMALAEQLGIARSTVSILFTGKPIQREIFSKICETLGLDWRDITDIGEEEAESDIEVLVQEVRQKVRPIIQERCGTMRVLDMSQPIGLNDIYTDVNILEKITGRRRLEITELLQGFNPESEDFDRFGLSRVTQKRVPGLEAVEHYSKLMVLGKPGAGKTTFLKYLAIQCISGEFQAHRVPIFITLKDFAETPAQPALLEFITQMFANSGVTDTQITELLKQGRALLFLDGLDEVRDEDSQRVLREIRYFSEQYYTNNFVITCRIAAQDYRFERFTDVEIADVEVADFDDKQIQTFVTKWFQAKQLNLAELFMERLNSNPPIRELAASPLLLTLLCLVFEDSGDFPANHAELYHEGISILLKKWDVTRGIERDQVYKNLSVQRKEELLSQVAMATFEQGKYFFKQRELERYIADYIRNLPDAQTDPEALQLDSEVVLKSIEAQHGLLVERARGIYSFSHLTFQEYFAARKIATTCDPYSSDDKTLESLVRHLTEKRWREVFLLAVGMLQSADCFLLLMKQQVDSLVAEDENSQQFISYLYQNSLSYKSLYKPAAIRACAFDPSHRFNIWEDFDLEFRIEPEFDFVTLVNSPNERSCQSFNEDWQFSEQQIELLMQYYYANVLLVDCLNSDCSVSREVRSHIEDTLLLPIAEIEKRKLGD